MADRLQLKNEYLEMVKTDAQLTAAVAKATGKSISTVFRWCFANDEKLTMLSVINCIKEYKQLGNDVIIYEQYKEQAA